MGLVVLTQLGLSVVAGVVLVKSIMDNQKPMARGGDAHVATERVGRRACATGGPMGILVAELVPGRVAWPIAAVAEQLWRGFDGELMWVGVFSAGCRDRLS
ncbi:hypothetical protein ACFE04_027617 [Oxalis oulophora]